MYPSAAKETADLIRLADQALYQAKRAGRDRVQVSVHTEMEAATV